jgi:molybdate/tungstate transport system substrate-binding protein
LPFNLNSERSISNLVAIGIVIVILASAVIGVYYFAYMAPGNSNGRSGNSALILYSADAYVAEATALESAFTANSGTLMAPPKSGGSLLLAQEIAQGNPVSIFLSVAKSAVSPVTLGSASSGWAVSFASDQMTIAYSNITIQDNAASGVINSYLEALQTNSTQDWHNFFLNLTSGDVKVGISNPNVDPAGYRAWIVLESAGMTYANGKCSGFNSAASIRKYPVSLHLQIGCNCAKTESNSTRKPC